MPLAPANIVCTKRSCPGTSMKPRTLPIASRHVGKAEVNGNAARLLFLQAIAVDAGQRFDQSRLAVVDVACSTDDHGAFCKNAGRDSSQRVTVQCRQNR